ncbi:MAG: GNAT family N-acetyltransferase, partial [Novosphingobium sp.]
MSAAAPRERPEILEADPARRTALVATLARAFADDPAMCWIFPDRAERIKRLPRLFTVLVDEEFEAGWTLASPGCEAVTLWRGHEAVHAGIWDTIRGLPSYFGALGRHLPRAL